jgi:Transposase
MNETSTPNEKSTSQKRARRHYDAEVKNAAVEHCRRHGGDPSHTAGELGVHYWILRDWVRRRAPACCSAVVVQRAWDQESMLRSLSIRDR